MDEEERRKAMRRKEQRRGKSDEDEGATRRELSSLNEALSICLSVKKGNFLKDPGGKDTNVEKDVQGKDVQGNS